jgi:hypothetical protein
MGWMIDGADFPAGSRILHFSISSRLALGARVRSSPLTSHWYPGQENIHMDNLTLVQSLDIALQPVSSTATLWFIIHYPTILHCLFTDAASGSDYSIKWKTSVTTVCIPAEIWTKCWTQVKPEPACLVTVYVLSELLTWLSKQLQKLKIHYRPDAHEGHFSSTVTIWPQNICWQCHLNMKQTV